MSTTITNDSRSGSPTTAGTIYPLESITIDLNLDTLPSIGNSASRNQPIPAIPNDAIQAGWRKWEGWTCDSCKQPIMTREDFLKQAQKTPYMNKGFSHWVEKGAYPDYTHARFLHNECLHRNAHQPPSNATTNVSNNGENLTTV